MATHSANRGADFGALIQGHRTSTNRRIGAKEKESTTAHRFRLYPVTSCGIRKSDKFKHSVARPGCFAGGREENSTGVEL